MDGAIWKILRARKRRKHHAGDGQRERLYQNTNKHFAPHTIRTIPSHWNPRPGLGLG
jgi:hypothetical protein